MISRIHNKLGTAGFVVAIVALVAALSGAAIAAGGGLTGKQKKEVKKIAKSVANPGPAGPAGPQGLPGAAGAKGDTGAAGADGEDGQDGAAGKSVIVGTPTVAECPNGGATVQKEGETLSKKAVCNGEDGETGFVKELPYEESVTGAWSLGLTDNETPFYFFSVSYGFKLPEGKKATPVFVKTPGEESTNCPGNVNDPKAAAGKVCYYVHIALPEPGSWAAGVGFDVPSSTNTSYPSGNTVKFKTGPFPGCFTEENCAVMQLSGTWAVKAPADPTP
jgi:Collagen triple helix repeat (20 copies)